MRKTVWRIPLLLALAAGLVVAGIAGVNSVANADGGTDMVKYHGSFSAKVRAEGPERRNLSRSLRHGLVTLFV
ncbi:hypothetical protein [Allorhizocola rhizosphaerae]|uniref:hypothetical protein n=1 Tax=Allorhizocola rhizosphaerae TaxID=1872709 RepID=UPI000E3D902C|nr:hypothetical protein [Allorhizocola rhizosphaerae]